MKTEVLEHRKNPLMKREEAWVILEHEGKPTPKRPDLVPELAKKFGSKPELVIVDKLFSETGKAATKVKVLVYKNKADIPKAKQEKMDRRIAKIKKEKPAEEPKAAEAKPEEKPAEGEAKEEKPAEEKKEEAPAEKEEPKAEAPKEEPKEEKKEEKAPEEEKPKE